MLNFHSLNYRKLTLEKVDVFNMAFSLYSLFYISLPPIFLEFYFYHFFVSLYYGDLVWYAHTKESDSHQLAILFICFIKPQNVTVFNALRVALYHPSCEPNNQHQLHPKWAIFTKYLHLSLIKKKKKCNSNWWGCSQIYSTISLYRVRVNVPFGKSYIFLMTQLLLFVSNRKTTVQEVTYTFSYLNNKLLQI